MPLATVHFGGVHCSSKVLSSFGDWTFREEFTVCVLVTRLSFPVVRPQLSCSVQEALLNKDNRTLVQLASDHSSEAIMGYAQITPDRRMNLSAKVNRSLAGLMSSNRLI